MSRLTDPVLDCPVDLVPDARELTEAAMRWHFGPRTGSRFWLERAKTLDFDPIRDVRTPADLRLFPNIVDELRDVPVEDLVPQGYGTHSARPWSELYGVFESGGTTGAPKRVVAMNDWMERLVTWFCSRFEEHGCPRGANWLAVAPTGPHIFGAVIKEQARRSGGTVFTIDMDPRWVKRCLGEGRTDEAGRYAQHLIEQAAYLLETQNVGVLVTTPPLLERISGNERLVALINEKVRFILWSGTHMDADTRHLLRTEVFPGIRFMGGFGNTMLIGGGAERFGLTAEDPCVFDPFAPYISFSVVDPVTGEEVPYGERGQVVMNHLSKAMLLPNNLERDMATRVRPPAGQLSDSIADVGAAPAAADTTVIEGVY